RRAWRWGHLPQRRRSPVGHAKGQERHQRRLRAESRRHRPCRQSHRPERQCDPVVRFLPAAWPRVDSLSDRPSPHPEELPLHRRAPVLLQEPHSGHGEPPTAAEPPSAEPSSPAANFLSLSCPFQSRPKNSHPELRDTIPFHTPCSVQENKIPLKIIVYPSC